MVAISILVVDDEPRNVVALEAALASVDCTLVKARSGLEALKCVLAQDFAVIVLDVHMPDMDGFETASLIRERERSHATPIMSLTADERGGPRVRRVTVSAPSTTSTNPSTPKYCARK